MPRFALLTADGKDLGTVHLGRPDWPAGAILYRGGTDTNLRVVRIVKAPDSDQLDVLVVEEVGPT